MGNISNHIKLSIKVRCFPLPSFELSLILSQCAGLKQYSLLLSKYSSDPSSYNPEELRGNMDSWREVLFRHLDEEVHDLGAESMRKAGWTLDEVKRMPM